MKYPMQLRKVKFFDIMATKSKLNMRDFYMIEYQLVDCQDGLAFNFHYNKD